MLGLENFDESPHLGVEPISLVFVTRPVVERGMTLTWRPCQQEIQFPNQALKFFLWMFGGFSRISW
jgi:hypothetical protein